MITFPVGTVVLDWVVTVPNLNPALVMAVLAAACVKPTTFGTAVPLDTVMFTGVPPVADVPPAGV